MSILPDHRILVEQLLKSSNITSPPVKLATIAHHWSGLQITVDDIQGDAFFIDLGALGSNILIKRSATKERQRFSLAHEFGHMVLIDSGVPIDASTPHARNDEIERWCNVFASELLMPTAWVRSDILTCDISHLYVLTHEISKKYEVSIEAALIRITELAPISAFKLTLSRNHLSVKYNESKEAPLPFGKYKMQIVKMTKSKQASSSFAVDPGVYCVLQAQLLTSSEQTWRGFLVKSKDGIKIDLM